MDPSRKGLWEFLTWQSTVILFLVLGIFSSELPCASTPSLLPSLFCTVPFEAECYGPINAFLALWPLVGLGQWGAQ